MWNLHGHVWILQISVSHIIVKEQLENTISKKGTLSRHGCCRATVERCNRREE